MGFRRPQEIVYVAAAKMQEEGTAGILFRGKRLGKSNCIASTNVQDVSLTLIWILGRREIRCGKRGV